MVELEVSVATLRVQLAALQASIDDLTDPKEGRLAKLEEQMVELLKIKQQTEGAINLLKVLAIIVSSGAAAWAYLVAHWPGGASS